MRKFDPHPTHPSPPLLPPFQVQEFSRFQVIGRCPLRSKLSARKDSPLIPQILFSQSRHLFGETDNVALDVQCLSSLQDFEFKLAWLGDMKVAHREAVVKFDIPRVRNREERAPTRHSPTPALQHALASVPCQMQRVQSIFND